LLAVTGRALKRTGGALTSVPCSNSFSSTRVSRFGFDCTHARHAGDAASMLAEHVSAVDSRYLEFTKCEGDRLTLRFRLDPVGGATLRVALEPLCARSGAGDERLRARRLADGLVELASHTLDHGFTTERGGPCRAPGPRPGLRVARLRSALRVDQRPLRPALGARRGHHPRQPRLALPPPPLADP
jgi:hypothetical protein